MADLFITELDAITDFDDTDLVVVEKNPGGTPETNKMTIADVITKYLVRNTYQISRTVASNNLTVAIKDSDGNNATAAKPLNFNINGTIRKLSGSLSVAVNAGVNTFNLGAAEFLNSDQELFVYIGYRASDTSVFVLLSRMPHKREYADFSATATSERYGAYSGSAPAATDKVAVIGRVNIRNSGTASFNWSIPAADVVINRQVERTNWLSWAPTQTGYSANPTLVAQYKIIDDTIFWAVNPSAGGTSNATTSTITLPFVSATLAGFNNFSVGYGQDNGAAASPVFRIVNNTNILDAYKGPGQTVWTNTGTKFYGGQGFYKLG